VRIDRVELRLLRLPLAHFFETSFRRVSHKPFGMTMIEQPLGDDDIADHARLQRRLRTPICLDEWIHAPRVAMNAIEAGACRVVNIKPGRLGGFAESIAVHDTCAGSAVPVPRTTRSESRPMPRFLLLRRLQATLACLILFASAGFLPGCASVGGAPAPALQPAAPVISYEQKLAWVLRLEDQRALRDPAAARPLPTAGAAGPVATVASAPRPDLTTLLTDADPRVRRRSALAIGRVGLTAGVRPLLKALAGDQEPEVRQMAAFALGLLRDTSAVPELRVSLGDPAPLVQGRAAEALGALGDTASSQAIAGLVAAAARSAEVAAVAPDDVEETHAPVVEAFRLGVLALGRLEDYDALASAVLDSNNRPIVVWWPVAAAFQRTKDRRAAFVLTAFARGESSFGRAFAARGLGVLKDRGSVDTLVALARDWPRDTRAAIAAVRSLGLIADRRAGPALIELLRASRLDPLLQLEVIAALAPTRDPAALDQLLGLALHPVAAVRAAAFTSLRDLDPENYLLVLSGLDVDSDWRVRAAIASSLGTLDRDSATPRLSAMLKDQDLRVVASVLAALAKIKPPGIEQVLLEWLKHEDVVLRAAAASGLGELKPAGGERALAEAFHAAARDQAYGARAAALDALMKYGPEAARPVLHEALADKDWAIRVRAASLLAPLEPATDPAAAIRPAPTNREVSFYDAPELVTPSVSPRVYIDTERGRIEIEMGVLDAPLTCHTFMALARQGFFNGVKWHRIVPNFVAQAGDPRGDGEGGPGFTIRDEINERPYLRGTMGMALEWADTGGSQFFLTHSPQPHLDGRYTVFGQVVRGLEVLDSLRPGDAITRVWVWDGKTMAGGEKKPEAGSQKIEDRR
jgi:cyclophilin family peptidyl-prolyl cis-trans isomerase/HEAT repeat protein